MASGCIGCGPSVSPPTQPTPQAGMVGLPSMMAPFLTYSGPADVGVEEGLPWLDGGRIDRKALVPHPLRWARHRRSPKKQGGGLVRFRG